MQTINGMTQLKGSIRLQSAVRLLLWIWSDPEHQSQHIAAFQSSHFPLPEPLSFHRPASIPLTEYQTYQSLLNCNETVLIPWRQIHLLSKRLQEYDSSLTFARLLQGASIVLPALLPKPLPPRSPQLQRLLDLAKARQDQNAYLALVESIDPNAGRVLTGGFRGIATRDDHLMEQMDWEDQESLASLSQNTRKQLTAVSNIILTVVVCTCFAIWVLSHSVPLLEYRVLIGLAIGLFLAAVESYLYYKRWSRLKQGRVVPDEAQRPLPFRTPQDGYSSTVALLPR